MPWSTCPRRSFPFIAQRRYDFSLYSTSPFSTSSDKASVSKKKKKPFPLLGSNPSVVPLDLKKPNSSPAVMLKKSSGWLTCVAQFQPSLQRFFTSAKKAAAATSSSRKGSAGPLNASFVNSSFLSEDLDSPPAQQSLRL